MFSDELKNISWEETTERIARMTDNDGIYLVVHQSVLNEFPAGILIFCRVLDIRVAKVVGNRQT